MRKGAGKPPLALLSLPARMLSCLFIVTHFIGDSFTCKWHNQIHPQTLKKGIKWYWKDTGATHRWQDRGRVRLQGIAWHLNQELASCLNSESSSHHLSPGPHVLMSSLCDIRSAFLPRRWAVSCLLSPITTAHTPCLLSSVPASQKLTGSCSLSSLNAQEEVANWPTWSGVHPRSKQLSFFLPFGELGPLRKMHICAIFTPT